ncbi:invasion associated locus B family protein [Rhodoplanes azumiensis]|uniref:Invasion associated locus B family protein n=1 Tax=Rhodoplanes azumiensis TaxID=1897628 RepID=A0ABW5AL55_9BRAD
MPRSPLPRLALSRLVSSRLASSRLASSQVAAALVIAAFAAATLADAAPALAQAPAPNAAPATGGGAPTRTTATYEDWTVRCETPPGAQQKTCEVFQAQQQQGQAGPVSQIAIGRAGKTGPHKLVAQIPVNVWLATAPRLLWDDKQAPIALGFKRCVPGGCFADADIPDDLLRRMKARAEPGRLEYKDAIQRDVGIAVSFKGFSQAIDALAKQ